MAEDQLETLLDASQHAGGERRARGAPIGARIQGRYLVLAEIGRGGMAAIYRATDLANQREVALKLLVLDRTQRHYATSAELFEREFHTLAELSHPRVIAVHDYGIDEQGPFYTMELLDGGDLRSRSPLPWREACSLLYDVCSSLALLHSRRLVHRDVTPGNVRCTRDGQAKLIDFGAMVPMGRGGLVVGTPQFIAPEVVHGVNLDARTDLFSLGVTLYFSLTGRAPFQAKRLSELTAAWTVTPAPPSRFAPEIPQALDELVLALIAIEAAMRPRTAFEVMQRLAAIAGIERAEPVSVSRAYLAAPVMLGREKQMAAIRAVMSSAFGGRGGAVLIQGVAGVGRSRMLDSSALAAKTLGATLLRASGSTGATGSFRVAAALIEQLLASEPEAAWSRARREGVFDVLFEPGAAPAGDDAGAGAPPKLKDLGADPAARFEIQTALARWLPAMARKRALVVAVDDFHRIDEPSAALLAALASHARGRRLLIIATVETHAEPTDRLALEVLARHGTSVELEPLERADSARLFETIFGDVPNVAIVSDGIHAIARGNPRASLDLAQHLVDRGLVRYERGAWTLPARLESSDLPRSAEEAMRARIAALTPLARWLAEAQALATYQALTRADYARLRPDAGANELDRAISELVSHQIVVSDGLSYSPAHHGWCAALEQLLGDVDRAARHRALVPLYEGRRGLGLVRHALLGKLEARALDELAPLLATLPEATAFYETTDLAPSEIAATFERALSAAERIGRSRRELNELRRWLASLSVVSDDAYYRRAVPAWLEQLKHDSGYTLWQQSQLADPQARLSDAMRLAFERHVSTPEAERVYRPDEAIKGLAHYVGISLAIGSSRIELALTDSLPALLEPFAPLSDLVHAIWQNAIAAREAACRAQLERARSRWREVYDQLGRIEGAEQQFVGVFRRAIAHAIGSTEASIGLLGAAEWADQLEDDPVQRINGLHLRRIVRLQQGDWEGAERFRRRAELLSLQARARQMFNTLTAVELTACAMARDLSGLKQVGERVRALATRSPGWTPFVWLAEGHFHLLCDTFATALDAFERGLELVRPSVEEKRLVPASFCPLVAGRLDALVGAKRNEEARSAGETALATCRSLEIGVASHPISRALALAEAQTGEHGRAAARLEAVIANQVELGITGLHLGASYEARARVAIWAADKAAIEHFAALTAREYRYGRGSPLGACYKRLLHEARRNGEAELPALADLEQSSAMLTQVTRITDVHAPDTALDSTEDTITRRRE